MNFINTKTRRLPIRYFIGVITAVVCHSISAHADTALGSAEAPVTIVEYGSLTCDYCVRFHREVLPLIQSRHIDTGKVRFIYRDFPTGAAATRGAIAARCVAPNHYYRMLDALFVTVGRWSRERDVDAALVQQASALEIDDAAFRACLKDPRRMRDLREAQRQATQQYAVIGTPTFLVNGEIVRGIRTIDEMEALIAEAQSRVRTQDADGDTKTSSPEEE
tara:strand:+ start:20877 stop:21536 length:660 start_codon:yes stop_codon:yes gene_type:complete